MPPSKRLIVIAGPTASGKTALAVRVAQRLGTEIVSCDSRQFYKELAIGVARPSKEELSAARHHFIACRSVTEPYNVSQYEDEALSLLDTLFERHETVVAVGGSGLYIDAICQGMARMPDPTPELRARLKETIVEKGVEPLILKLKELDPEYYSRCDRRNPVRVQRALEVILTTGRPYSEVIAQSPTPRQFTVEKVAIELSPEILRRRIDDRVDAMFGDTTESATETVSGNNLVGEARRVMAYRHLQPLNTVGYKELFAYFDGQCSLDEARQRIKYNTWHYAKKQQTWLRRYNDIRWLKPESMSEWVERL